LEGRETQHIYICFTDHASATHSGAQGDAKTGKELDWNA
jgi:hypothetical protein